MAIFTAMPFHPNTFTRILWHLVTLNTQISSNHSSETPHCRVTSHDTPNLQELAVNASCTDEINAPILAQISGLSILSIYSPTRAILDLLPDWLRRLSDSLTELHLKDNCGSVTPGVLRSIVPFMERSIRVVSLGLSYSLMDEDVFVFLRNLRELQSIELNYYWQLRSPKVFPNLTRLKSFTACYTNVQTRKEAQSLCQWIRRVISTSSIQVLHIVQDGQKNDDDDDDGDGIPSQTGANVSFRSIIDHLCSRHSMSLRILDMKNAYVDVKSLKKLFTSCKVVEEVYLCTGRHVLTIFKKHSASLTQLHTAFFNIKNTRLSRWHVIDLELVSAIIKQGPVKLRMLSINGQTWTSAWKYTKEGSVVLTIQKQLRLVLPWDREEKPSSRQAEALLPTQSCLKQEPTVNSEPATEESKNKVTDVGGNGRLRVRFKF